MHRKKALYESQIITQRQGVQQATERYKTDLDRALQLYGTDTGHHELNLIINGWVPGKVTSYCQRSGGGKCLGYGTKIRMFDNSLKEVQDIKEGDLILGVNGESNKVVSICSGEDNMYRIHQHKAMSYDVNSVHVLSLKGRSVGKRIYNDYSPKDEIRNIPLNEYLNKSNKWKRMHMGYKEPSIYPEQILPIDPYFLGVWLGDGTASQPEITTQDKEIVEYIYEFANKIGANVSEYSDKRRVYVKRLRLKSKTFKHNTNPFLNMLKDNNLLNNKHIPDVYMTSGVDQRKELLAGLLDTDGYIHSNRYEIAQVRENLAIQIKGLADSLGYNTRIRIKYVKDKPYYIVSISGHTMDTLPMRIDYKRVKNVRINQSISRISVESLGIGKYYGFTLENEDRRFFLEDNTVTHNTQTFIQMMKAAHDGGSGRRSQILFFSWEMQAKDLVNRYVSHSTGFTSTQLKYPKLLTAEDRKLVEQAYKDALSFPVEYHQMPTNVSGVIPILEEFCQRTRERSDIEGRFIQPVMALDFISMLKGGSATNRTYQIGEFTQTLKNTAEKEGLACFLLQQLNRTADNKDVPDITDISDSQAIEQNSDTVIIGHRPEQLNRTEIVDPSTGTTLPSKGKMLWRVMKNREGACGDIILNIDAARNRMWSEGMEWNTPYQHLYESEEFWKNRFS